MDTKLIQLQIARERTEETIQRKRCDKIERKIKALKELSGEADQLKGTLEGLKIAAKKSAEAVKQWNDHIEEKITRADDDILRLKEWLEETKREENQKIREEELQYERQLFRNASKISNRVECGQSEQGRGKDKYGKESEIVKAYNKEILELPVIFGVEVKAIHQFHERLAYCVQSLQTMGKLDQVNGNVPMTLDKLSGIRGDLVRTDDSWENWDFVKLCEALRLWIRRNPVNSISAEEVDSKSSRRRRERPDKLFAAKQWDLKQRKCVYCEDTSHVSWEYPKISILHERKKFLAQRHLCFNCTYSGHQASKCGNKYSCRNCGHRHHTSICDRMETP
ncbi:uncharacterized protein LOC111343117 [Stylophora pistillata]|nr:uncharacterized protein LOC111343117 [Stylophora pistillata]